MPSVRRRRGACIVEGIMAEGITVVEEVMGATAEEGTGTTVEGRAKVGPWARIVGICPGIVSIVGAWGIGRENVRRREGIGIEGVAGEGAVTPGIIIMGGMEEVIKEGIITKGMV